MRYPALRLIVAISYLLAAVVALVVFLAAQREWGVGLALVLAALAPVGIVAMAEVLRVLMDMEESLRGLRSGPTAAPQPLEAPTEAHWKARMEKWFLS